MNLPIILLLSLIFILSFLVIFLLLKLFSARKSSQQMSLEIKNLTILNDETRTFKHDFHNIVQAFGGYIWANDFDGLKKYYSQIFNHCINMNSLTKLNPDLINEPAIYAILTNKFELANNQNIQFNIDILSDFKKINLPSLELSRILGILLDNAIEASKECNEKSVNFVFRETKNKLILQIENTYSNKDISTKTIFEKNFSTKKYNSGIGLWEVKKIIQKYRKLNLYTSKNDKYFSQQLELSLL